LIAFNAIREIMEAGFVSAAARVKILWIRRCKKGSTGGAREESPRFSFVFEVNAKFILAPRLLLYGTLMH
jgi:hypothetical protein